jgi:signal transduction histidine kinase
MNLLINLDLFSVGMAVAGTVLLGFTIFFNDRSSITNRTFLTFSLITGAWGIVNFFSYRVVDPALGLWLVRITIFLAVWQAFSLHRLFYVFPQHDFTFSRSYTRYFLPLTVLVSLVTLSPWALERVLEFSENGRILKIVNGPGMLPFGLLSVSLVIFGFIELFRKIRRATEEEKKPLRLIFMGGIIMFVLIIGCNFILPSLFGVSSLIPFGALFILPLIISVWFAIYRHNLLNVKALTVTLLTGLLALVTFSEVILAENLALIVFRSFIFILVLFFGTLIIRSIQNEIRQREEIAGLAKKLTETNWQLARTNEQLRVIDQRKSEFVSIVSHQLRTPITAVKGYTSLLLEDAYGPLTEKQRPQVEKIFISSERLAQMVNDFLDISKIEQGTMKYELAPADIGEMLSELMEDFQPIAEKKGLILDLVLPEDKKVEAVVDAGKLRQIFSNLLDNAIKYTPQGKVAVTLVDDPQVKEIVVRMKDSGVGLSQDDVHHLFGKFTRGSQGQKQNTEGSGLGLYVAKKMLEAMNGRIWVDSEGIGKGSTFVIALARGDQK